ncbi:LysR family transcriptional regulator [Herbaspirillum rubrisubalbicans]|uniref:LysR family transcriptional regulator n=1 Tax=Herbaspirillum rubrisubalbicans TaxID=80842 RepID=A0ABX9C264_9BURK|nr:LysR family transcriptional regulator [Herbaspirillum rubrisubalbicans]RAM64202.1 LysR family transcriptional regulator [Herbaspirillum rubrisubalbicans]RAN49747.1 LysR family transcriptional regulator [Herbaspirillum rubrisubalbicans]
MNSAAPASKPTQLALSALAALDVRLLRLLDALLDEVHLARAAARVGLSLPAAASALERCRQLLRDPLLEDGGLQMRLTATAQALREPLHKLLYGDGVGKDSNAVADQAQPEQRLATLARRVRILMPDYPAQVVVQALYQELRAAAPLLDLEFQTWLGEADAIARLERGQTELVLGAATPALNLRGREVLQERCVAVMRRDHPAAHQLTLARWLDYPHLQIACHDTLNRMMDQQVAMQGRRRRIGMVIPNFLMAPALLQGSDLIAVMPMHCVPAATAAHPVALTCLRPPLPLEAPPLRLLQHRRHADDLAVAHVAQVLERIVRQRFEGR